MLAAAQRCPIGHGVGADAPAGQKEPAVHAACAPADEVPAGQKWPASHGVCAITRLATGVDVGDGAQKVPGAHTAGALRPVAPQN